MSFDENSIPQSTVWMDGPHQPSCGVGEPRRFTRAGRPWLVCEDASEFGPALLFFGPGIARRVHHYPGDWRTLPDDALYRISCAR